MEGCEEQLRKGWKGDWSSGAVQVLKLPSTYQPVSPPSHFDGTHQ